MSIGNLKKIPPDLWKKQTSYFAQILKKILNSIKYTFNYLKSFLRLLGNVLDIF